jgi:hypothetical protein
MFRPLQPCSFVPGLNPHCGGAWRDVAADAIIPQNAGRPNMDVRVGDQLWMSFVNANVNVWPIL